MASLRKTVIKEPNVGAIVKARTSVIINTVFENKKKKSEIRLIPFVCLYEWILCIIRLNN